MISKILFVTLFVVFISRNKTYSQTATCDTAKTHIKLVEKVRPLIIPVLLIGYGVIGIDNHPLQNLDRAICEEFTEHVDEHAVIDNYSQYAPSLAVYALNIYGVKGKNNLRDRTVILATSYLFMTATVNLLKSVSDVIRPDGSSNNSFPSGHTATAFVGAEFLWHEYKDVSVWYGIAGYTVAAGTGFYRMYNNKHWLTDVAAGAGIGMLSTKFAYWVNPFITRKLFKTHDNLSSAVLYPFYNGEQTGLGLSLCF
jgi:hypothetical protein